MLLAKYSREGLLLFVWCREGRLCVKWRLKGDKTQEAAVRHLGTNSKISQHGQLTTSLWCSVSVTEFDNHRGASKQGSGSWCHRGEAAVRFFTICEKKAGYAWRQLKLRTCWPQWTQETQDEAAGKMEGLQMSYMISQSSWSVHHAVYSIQLEMEELSPSLFHIKGATQCSLSLAINSLMSQMPCCSDASLTYHSYVAQRSRVVCSNCTRTDSPV